MRRAAIAVIVVAVAAVVAHWVVSRRRARRGAADVYSAAVALAACALDRAPPQQQAQLARLLTARIDLAFATSRPLAECGDAARELGARAGALRAAPYHRSPEDVATLASLAGDLNRFAWNDPASALATSSRTAHVAELLGRALAVGCDVAVAEKVFASPPCPRAGPTRTLTLPAPHGALGVALGAAVGEVRWSAEARDDTLVLAVSGTSRDRRVTGTWLSVRRGTGPWAQIDADTARSAGDAPFVAPSVAFDGASPAFVLDGQREAGGGWHGVVSRLDLPHASSTRVARFDALPAGLSPLRAASRLLVVDHAPALALGQGASGAERGALLFPSAREPAPVGRAIAAWQTDRARLALVRPSAKGLELAAFDVPAPGGTWPDPLLASIPGAETPGIDADSAAICGDHFVAAARAGARTLIVDVGPAAARVVPIAARPGTTLQVVCGACAPLVLERGDAGLRLLSADGSAVRDVPLPVAADVAARRAASAACTRSGLLLAYVTRGTLLVQRAAKDGTAFTAPTPIAAATHDGAPLEVHVLAVGDRAVVLWRRAKRGTRDVALEYVESADAATWH